MKTLRKWLIVTFVPEWDVTLEQAEITRRLLAEARMENSTLTRKVRAMEERAAEAFAERLKYTETAEARIKDLEAKEELLRANLNNLASDNEQLLRQLSVATKQARMPFEARETDSAPPWLPEDAQWWRDVLAGPRGQRIKQALNFWSNYKDRAAVTRLDRHEYACGEAAGFYLCAEFLLNKLSADIQPQSDEDGKAGQGASSLHERIAP